MARLGFNANEVAPDQGGGCLPESGPEGYLFQAVEEGIKTASSGKGEVLSLEFEVIEGPFQGRKMWVTMNVAHENPVAQQIGQGQLSALCHAMGYMQVEDSEELLWKPFRATTKVGSEEYKGNTRERAAIKKYISAMDAAPPASKPRPAQPASRATAAAPQRPGASTGGRDLPWKNRNGSQAGGGRMNDVIDDDIPF